MYEYQPPHITDVVWLIEQSAGETAYDAAIRFLIDDAIYMVTLSVQLDAYDEFDFGIVVE